MCTTAIFNVPCLVKDHLVVGERVQEDDDEDGEDVGEAEDDGEQVPQAPLVLLNPAKSNLLLKICRRTVEAVAPPLARVGHVRIQSFLVLTEE